MQWGLTELECAKINEVFSRFPSVESVVLYGSRAKGNFRASSDIDLTLKGSALNLQTLNKISIALDDLLLPVKFDVSLFEHIDNVALRDHIQRVGQLFYKKKVI